ncbi:MAG: iron complex outermembrane receptor protein [Alcanivorax sp.]|jgi:iron complex outermembrane receptor protein
MKINHHSRLNRPVNNKLRIAVRACMGLALSAGLSPFVQAQDAGKTNMQLEEVIVTSRFRAESIQDVPIAVTAITAELENPSIRNLRDLEGLAPNVQIRHSMGRTAGHAISIRGIGYSNDEKSFDPAVGVVIDGVAMTSTSGTLLDNFDIEKVEIMRGPQGTLFGKNTIAGVINVTRTDPTGELGGDVRATLGNFGRTDVKAVINTPIIENVLAAKLFVASLKDDGYIENVTLDKDVAAQDYLSYGLALLWTPNENLRAKLTVEGIDDDSDNGAFRNLTGRGGDRGIALQDGFSGGWQPYSPAIVPITGNPRYAENASFPDVSGEGCLEINDPDSRPDTTSASQENIGEMETDAITLQVDWQIGDDSTLTYIYGYRDTEELAVWPYSGSQCDFITVDNYNENDQESHELRWAKSTDSFSVVLGLYQMENSYSQDWFTYDFWELIRSPESLVANYAATPEQVARLGSDFGQNIFQSQETTGRAVFGQLDYWLTDKLELTVGARYTKDDKDFFARDFCIKADQDRDLQNWDNCVNTAATRGESSGGTFNGDLSESKTTGRLGFAYQLQDDILLYGAASTGFHSGGFYGKNQALSAFAVTYAPEEITSYEIGAKMELLDRRLRLNLAAFNSTVEDLQAVTTIPNPADGTSISAPFNVGEVEYQGLELEAVGIVTGDFRVSASVGYLDASYTSFDADLSGRTGGVPIDNSYLEPKQAPEWTLGVTANYSTDFAGGLIGANAMYAWTDDFYTQEDNDPISLVESYGKINLDLGYERDSYRITAFVNNLTDETNFVSRTSGTLISYGQESRGRTFGVELAVTF